MGRPGNSAGVSTLPSSSLRCLHWTWDATWAAIFRVTRGARSVRSPGGSDLARLQEALADQCWESKGAGSARMGAPGREKGG